MPCLIFYLENTMIIGHLFNINSVLLSNRGLSQSLRKQVTIVPYTNTGNGREHWKKVPVTTQNNPANNCSWSWLIPPRATPTSLYWFRSTNAFSTHYSHKTANSMALTMTVKKILRLSHHFITTYYQIPEIIKKDQHIPLWWIMHLIVQSHEWKCPETVNPVGCLVFVF